VRQAGLANVELRRADLLALPDAEASFDHVFVCFVLEHLRRPHDALVALLRHLKPGGTLTVIEGDHGPTFMHPDSAAARAAIHCQVRLQRRAGGNALVGRQLHPLLVAAGCVHVQASPRLVYVDGSRPDLAEAFTLRTFTAMIEGVRDAAIEAGFSSAERFDAGLRGLRRTAAADGVFGYSFFKAVAVKPAA
jgi:SAM-dependent methyltransferase